MDTVCFGNSWNIVELGEGQMIKKNEDLERMEKKLKKLALAIENPSSKKEYSFHD